jgi:hypothetical protein
MISKTELERVLRVQVDSCPAAIVSPRRRKDRRSSARAVRRQIIDHLPELIDNLVLLAGGVLVKGTGTEGESEVFERPPDRLANQYLIDRVLDKIPVGRERKPNTRRVKKALNAAVAEAMQDAARKVLAGEVVVRDDNGPE